MFMFELDLYFGGDATDGIAIHLADFRAGDANLTKWQRFKLERNLIRLRMEIYSDWEQ